jgi:cyanophycinase-like exopeptidase
VSNEPLLHGFCFMNFIVIDHHREARIALGRIARIEDAEQVAKQGINTRCLVPGCDGMD